MKNIRVHTTRRIILLYMWMHLVGLIQAQDTFSRTYHLEIGNDNRFQTLLVEEESFVVSTTHDGDMEVISGLTRFDYAGEILDQNIFPDYVFGESNTALKTEGGFELTGHTWSRDENNARGLELLKFSDDLEWQDRQLYFYEEFRSTNLPGILDMNDSTKAIYGSFVKTGTGIDAGAYVALLDKETDSLYSEIIFRGFPQNPYGEYRVNGLQRLGEKLIAIVDFDPGGAGPGTEPHLEIIKFTLEGEITNQIITEKIAPNEALFVDDEDNVYFYNRRIPFRLDTVLPFADRLGGMVKLNSSLDSVIWSFSIEDNGILPERRSHTVLGITQLSDGNFLACGVVGLVEDNIPEVVGFLYKFSKEGEVLWVREYGIPIPEEFVDLAAIGVLGGGRIEDCQELPDGRILCMGEHAYRIPGTSFYRELWVLMLDEEGCLEPGCGETNILTNTHTVRRYDKGVFYPNPTTDYLDISEVSFDEYRVYDLMGRLVDTGSFVQRIEVQDYAAGMYVLQLKEEGRLKSVFRFVVEVN